MNKWKKLRRQSLGAIPTESSSNLQAPEIAPRQKKEINIRTKPLNFKVSEKFYWELKNLALRKKCLMVEVLEKAVADYQESDKCPQCFKKGSEMDACDECGKDFCVECLTYYGELGFCEKCK
jgi:hypothetical protein